MGKTANQLLVIFGASGDLTQRMLVPAVFDLYMQNLLPEGFAVLGVARTDHTNESFREHMKASIRMRTAFRQYTEEDLSRFLEKLHYVSIRTEDVKDYPKLRIKLEELDATVNAGGNYVFYLSTPPLLYRLIPPFLSSQGLNKSPKGFRRIIVEKPFGMDLESAVELNGILLRHFDERQIYRIDHYLGKETVQNLLVTRFANSIYEPLWNRNFIQHVEISASETVGVENRGGYYDSAGALRDMIQNHLFQLLALVAMEVPSEISSMAIRNEKLKVFQSLRPWTEQSLRKNVIRGQYVSSSVRGKSHKGYREESGVNPESRTETYVAMKLFVDNWRWSGVPFYLRTGKCLPTRVSEVVIHFKPAPNHLFVGNDAFYHGGNQLVLRIHPDEGILLKTGMKVMGSGYQVRNVNMEFHYKNLENAYVPGAYERLLLDCMLGDPTLYTRGDALEDAWRFVQPILDFWKTNPDAVLHGYPCGTWGPDVADALIEDQPYSWRYPCRNLADDGIYCEL